MIASLLHPQVKASRANEFMIINPPTETSVAPTISATYEPSAGSPTSSNWALTMRRSPMVLLP